MQEEQVLLPPDITPAHLTPAVEPAPESQTLLETSTSLTGETPEELEAPASGHTVEPVETDALSEVVQAATPHTVGTAEPEAAPVEEAEAALESESDPQTESTTASTEPEPETLHTKILPDEEAEVVTDFRTTSPGELLEAATPKPEEVAQSSPEAVAFSEPTDTQSAATTAETIETFSSESVTEHLYHTEVTPEVGVERESSSEQLILEKQDTEDQEKETQHRRRKKEEEESSLASEIDQSKEEASTDKPEEPVTEDDEPRASELEEAQEDLAEEDDDDEAFEDAADLPATPEDYEADTDEAPLPERAEQRSEMLSIVAEASLRSTQEFHHQPDEEDKMKAQEEAVTLDAQETPAQNDMDLEAQAEELVEAADAQAYFLPASVELSRVEQESESRMWAEEEILLENEEVTEEKPPLKEAPEGVTEEQPVPVTAENTQELQQSVVDAEPLFVDTSEQQEVAEPRPEEEAEKEPEETLHDKPEECTKTTEEMFEEVKEAKPKQPADEEPKGVTEEEIGETPEEVTEKFEEVPEREQEFTDVPTILIDEVTKTTAEKHEEFTDEEFEEVPEKFKDVVMEVEDEKPEAPAVQTPEQLTEVPVVKSDEVTEIETPAEPHVKAMEIQVEEISEVKAEMIRAEAQATSDDLESDKHADESGSEDFSDAVDEVATEESKLAEPVDQPELQKPELEELMEPELPHDRETDEVFTEQLTPEEMVHEVESTAEHDGAPVDFSILLEKAETEAGLLPASVEQLPEISDVEQEDVSESQEEEPSVSPEPEPEHDLVEKAKLESKFLEPEEPEAAVDELVFDEEKIMVDMAQHEASFLPATITDTQGITFEPVEEMEARVDDKQSEPEEAVTEMPEEKELDDSGECAEPEQPETASDETKDDERESPTQEQTEQTWESVEQTEAKPETEMVPPAAEDVIEGTEDTITSEMEEAAVMETAQIVVETREFTAYSRPPDLTEELHQEDVATNEREHIPEEETEKEPAETEMADTETVESENAAEKEVATYQIDVKDETDQRAVILTESKSEDITLQSVESETHDIHFEQTTREEAIVVSDAVVETSEEFATQIAEEEQKETETRDDTAAVPEIPTTVVSVENTEPEEIHLTEARLEMTRLEDLGLVTVEESTAEEIQLTPSQPELTPSQPEQEPEVKPETETAEPEPDETEGQSPLFQRLKTCFRSAVNFPSFPVGSCGVRKRASFVFRLLPTRTKT